MLRRIYCSVVCLLASLLFSSYAEAAILQFSQGYVWVRVAGINEQILVPCSGTKYTDTDGRAGCNNAKYNYTSLTNPPSWPVLIGGFSYTETHHTNYWIWVYEGYSGGGSADWSKNCHGLAFGVGDWPDNSAILKADGTVNPVVNCWFADMSNATIADNTNHTVKIVVQNCPSSVGLKITSTSEKFRESPIFTQNSSCSGPGINLMLGNYPRGGMQFIPYRQ